MDTAHVVPETIHESRVIDEELPKKTPCREHSMRTGMPPEHLPVAASASNVLF
jgi:hypothetical protein